VDVFLVTAQTTMDFKAGILPVPISVLIVNWAPSGAEPQPGAGCLRPIGDLDVPPKLVDPASGDIQTSTSFKTSTDNGK